MAIILQVNDTTGLTAGIVVLMLVGILLYFIPAIVGRRKRSATSIFLLNLFLGWTFIGWVGALVWACSADAPPPVFIQNSNSLTTKVEQLERLASMYRNGVLSDEEFDAEKKKLLS